MENDMSEVMQMQLAHAAMNAKIAWNKWMKAKKKLENAKAREEMLSKIGHTKEWEMAMEEMALMQAKERWTKYLEVKTKAVFAKMEAKCSGSSGENNGGENE